MVSPNSLPMRACSTGPESQYRSVPLGDSMLMLSAMGLTTFTRAYPPAWTTDGVIVTSTWSGAGVRSTPEVEAPQPWGVTPRIQPAPPTGNAGLEGNSIIPRSNRVPGGGPPPQEAFFF